MLVYFNMHRAVSVLRCGSEILHSELKVRTACEMILNEDLSATIDYLSA